MQPLAQPVVPVLVPQVFLVWPVQSTQRLATWLALPQPRVPVLPQLEQPRALPRAQRLQRARSWEQQAQPPDQQPQVRVAVPPQAQPLALPVGPVAQPLVL